MDYHHSANQTFSEVLVNGTNSQEMYVDNDENIYLNIVNLSSTLLSIDFGKNVKFKITSIDANEATSDWIENTSIIVTTAQRFIVEIENLKESFQISTSLKTKENETYNVYYKYDESIEEQDFSGTTNSSMMSNNEFDELADNSKLIYDLVSTIDDLGVVDKDVDVTADMSLEMNNGYWSINEEAYPNTNYSHMAETHQFTYMVISFKL